MLAVKLIWTDSLNGTQSENFSVHGIKGMGVPDAFTFVPPVIPVGGDGSMRNLFAGFKRKMSVDFGVVNSLVQLKKILFFVQDTNRQIGTTLSAPTGLNATLPGIDAGLPPGTWYYVVTAVDEAGQSVPSTEDSQVTVNLASTVRLTWNAVTGASYYCVYRSTSSGVYTSPCLLTRTTAVTYDDNGLGTAEDLKAGAPSTGESYVMLADPFSHVVEWLDSSALGRAVTLRLKDRDMLTYWPG